MGFLNPWMLAVGALAAVPILLHLLHRHDRRRVAFPALRYLLRTEEEHARSIRLTQWLLLLLRVSAVLLLGAAAARPFVAGGGRAHEPTAVVIVLDNSASSGRVEGERRVLDRLRAAARTTVRTAGPGDRLWLLRAGEPWAPALPGG
ncbi:MAG: hypothetical protein D6701_06580, partial [Gemmatimonadetes bacterium]